MKTVRVRIAVAVNSNGGWWAAGTDMLKGDDATAAEAASRHMPHSVVHYVEADIPVPETVTVDGAVEIRHDR